MKNFTKESFDVFEVDGLDNRMAVIEEKIQPVFKSIHDNIIDDLNKQSNCHNEFHIARHIRRTVHPPESTWCAFGGDNRGYKKYPHLQIQINEEYILFAFAMIDNPKYEIPIAEGLIDNNQLWSMMDSNFKIMKDHTKTDLIDFTNENILSSLERVINVKKGEIMIGRIIEKNSPLLDDSDEQLAFIKDTYQKIMPVYKYALDIHNRLDEEE